MTNTLVLLRHAKSAYPPGVGDHDRPLSARGMANAPLAGRLIAAMVPHVDLAAVSTATRAQQTWSLASPALSVGAVENRPDLYLATAEHMLQQVQSADVGTLVVVAHNPGTEELARRLSDGADTAMHQQMLMKFPTAAFAVLECDAPFSQWTYGCATLRAFEVARG